MWSNNFLAIDGLLFKGQGCGLHGDKTCGSHPLAPLAGMGLGLKAKISFSNSNIDANIRIDS
jgi:hypothetical protein